MTTNEIPILTDADKERFWENVRKQMDGCWEWVGSKRGNGYGRFYVNGQSYGAHRVSFTITNGPIPSGMFALHHCDVRNCVNPHHLFLGTQTDNVKDMVQKHRQPKGETHGSRTSPGRLPRGERHHKAKVTERDVRDIRKEYGKGVSQRRLGREYGLAHCSIGSIVRGEFWKHVR